MLLKHSLHRDGKCVIRFCCCIILLLASLMFMLPCFDTTEHKHKTGRWEVEEEKQQIL